MTPSFLRGLLLVSVVVACSSTTVREQTPNAPPRVSETPAPDWAARAAERLPGMTPCTRPNVPEPVLCGTVSVPENRRLPGGRQLTLDVVVVPAQQASPPADPVFVFAGGPGAAATKRAASGVFAGPVRSRDIVLVDQRGTAGDHLLTCALGGGSATLGALGEMFPAADVQRCAKELGQTADLLRYGSVDFADDIEHVRTTLGYGAINIQGGSYGTRSMMVFAQRYPESTRSLLGIATVSPVRANLAARGVWAQQVLEGMGALCAGDAACGAVMPDLAATMTRLLATLSAGPRTVVVPDPSVPAPIVPDPSVPETMLTLDIHHDWLAENLRLILYYTFSSRALPWAAHRAEVAGDWTPLVQLAVSIQRMFQSSMAYGVLLAVQCGEGMDFDLAAARADGAQTLFGNYRLDQQVQGCEHWPHETRPPLGVAEPRVLDLPVLFLSGALDPVTPPAYAEDAAALFPNSRHIVLAEGQHGPFDLEDAWGCVHQIWSDFLDVGAVEGLDTMCTLAMRRPPFLTSADGFATYLADELAPLAP